MHTISVHAAKRLKEQGLLKKVPLSNDTATHYTTTTGTFNQTCYVCLCKDLMDCNISVHTLRKLDLVKIS